MVAQAQANLCFSLFDVLPCAVLPCCLGLYQILDYVAAKESYHDFSHLRDHSEFRCERWRKKVLGHQKGFFAVFSSRSRF